MERDTRRVRVILRMFEEGRTFGGEVIPSSLLGHSFDGITLTLRLNGARRDDRYVQSAIAEARELWPSKLRIVWVMRPEGEK